MHAGARSAPAKKIGVLEPQNTIGHAERASKNGARLVPEPRQGLDQCQNERCADQRLFRKPQKRRTRVRAFGFGDPTRIPPTQIDLPGLSPL